MTMPDVQPEQTPTPTPAPPAPPPPKEGIARSQRIPKDIPWSGLINGIPVEGVKLVLNPRTRHARDHAVEEGLNAYATTHGGGKGFYITAAEKAYACERIYSWSLPGTVADLWDLLDEDLGDLISDAIETASVVKNYAAQMKKGMVEAKNS